MVYAVKDSGLEVIDCNWKMESSQSNCVVQKHTIPYSFADYKGKDVYVNRVVNKPGITEVQDPTVKTQYGYYHYTNGRGQYSVCAHYGKETYGWTSVYREEIWVDSPLEMTSNSATSYRHPEVSGCGTAGCLDGDFWDAGGKYADEKGVVWYREQTRTVSKETKEQKSIKLIKKDSVKVTATPTSTPKPTVTPKATSTPKPSATPKATSTPKPSATPKVTSTPTPTPTTAVVSDWVKASDCPAGAEIVETKWTYTQRFDTESTSSYLDVWINTGYRIEEVARGTFEYATFPDGFDMSNSICNGMYTGRDAFPVTAGAEREILSDDLAGYIYWNYYYPVSGGCMNNRIIGYYYNQHLKNFGSWCYTTKFAAFKSSVNYSSPGTNNAGGGAIYKIKDVPSSASGSTSYWWFRFDYRTCTYRDVMRIYQYYKLQSGESFTEVLN